MRPAAQELQEAASRVKDHIKNAEIESCRDYGAPVPGDESLNKQFKEVLSDLDLLLKAAQQ